MEILMALVVGTLFTTGTYMLLRRSIVKLIIGLGLLSHGANLLLFTMGGLKQGAPPLLDPQNPAAELADPVPQALILTAIVISFGVMAFVLVLAFLTSEATGQDDLDELISTDK